MANDLWRWADPSGQQRTVRLDELRSALASGIIAPNTPVWRSGWKAWQAAHEVPELSSASVGGANGVVLNIPPPPLAMVAVQQEYEASSNSVVPVAPAAKEEEEPPPPPPYIPSTPMGGPSAAPLATQLAGSAYVPATAAAPAQVSPAPPPSKKLGPSLPTAIGLAPPPELFAMAQAAAAKPKSIPPPVPRAAPNGPVPVEELSDSALLDDASSPALPRPPLGADGLPPPTNPVVHGGEPEPTEIDEIPDFGKKPGLGALLDDLRALRAGQPPKNKAMLAVAGVIGFSVFVLLVAGVVSLFSGPSTKTAAAGVASASAKTVASAPTVTTATIPAPTASIPPPPPAVTTAAASDDGAPALGDCTAAGDARSIAPKAVIASGIEAHALPAGIGLGFSAGPRDAVATLLDPKTLAPVSTVRAKVTGGDAKRVTPIMNGSRLAAVADVERKNDKMSQRRIVTTGRAIDIGWADGAIVSAAHGKDAFTKLFAIESDIEVLRGTPLADKKSIALAFRRGNAIHVGAAKGEGALTADGDLSKIDGAGQVGTPAIAASGDRVIVAWAERAGADGDWKIRFTKMKPGSAPDEPTTFTPPDGGLGSHAMSPSVAGLGGGRFLLAWTEGPVSSHQVRAVTIGADGAPSGSAIAISAAGVNAGQPTAVVGSDGRGAVAFIAAKGKALEVWASAVTCAKR